MPSSIMNQFIATHGEDTLREENKKLKAHYDKTMSKEHGWGNAIMAEKYELVANAYEAKEEENDKLKEENKKLKELLIIREEGFEKVLKVRTNMAKGEIEFLEKENKKLKKENEQAWEEAERWETEAERTSELECIAWIDFYGEKEVLDDIKAYRFREDILAMKKENKELKNVTEQIRTSPPPVVQKYREEIKKLTGQLKEARDEIAREYDGRCADNDENDAREEKLKEENENLTDICEELNSIIPKCDGIDDIVCSVQLLIQSQ